MDPLQLGMMMKSSVAPDLKAKADVNGKQGRCGPWQADAGRYVVVIVFWTTRVVSRDLKFAPPITSSTASNILESQPTASIHTVWLKTGQCREFLFVFRYQQRSTDTDSIVH